MNCLTIDIGNQRVKVETWNNEGFMKSTIYEEVPYDEIKREVEDLDIKGIIIASVRNNSQEVAETLREKSGCGIIIDFNQKEIRKYYSSCIEYKGNIGADRIAAYVGGNVITPGAKLIIDAGTAITLDVADRNGNFCGGNISLGYEKRLEALAHSTRQLPEVEDLEKRCSFGNDTFSAIRAGVRNGVKGEVIYTLFLAKEEYGAERVIITGGDGHFIYDDLSREVGIYFFDEHLVGRGLNYHLRKFYFPEEFRHSNFMPLF